MSAAALVLPHDPEITDPGLDKTPTFTGHVPPDGDNRIHAPAGAAAERPDRLDHIVSEFEDAQAYRSPFGLSYNDRLEMRRCILRAANVGLEHAPEVHYTEGALRWWGITHDARSAKDQYPEYADCSAFATWTAWDASRWKHLTDIYNGAAWTGGYTGTLCAHGVRVDESTLLSADLVFYGGSLSVPEHVAVYIGAGRVISHGSEAGPLLLGIDYRPDRIQERRYVR